MSANFIIHFFKVFTFFLLIIPQDLYSQSLLLTNAGTLKEKRKTLKESRGNESNLLDDLLTKADSIIHINYWPRVTNKKLTPVSDDIHDYVSMATYYWPNPNSKNGLPYIGKDGKANPEVAKINNYSNLVQVSQRVKTLGLAYFYTDDDKYAKSAASLINVFFLRDDTKMNPNFKHAQFINGLNTGRLVGIIEARFFIELLQGVELMKDSNSFPNTYYTKLQAWFGEFLNWMENSDMGKKHQTLKNNIETSFHLQRIAYASFTGNNEKVKNIYQTSLKLLFKKQFTKQGKQPFELKRVKPEQYSIANLKYWYDIKSILHNNNVQFNKKDEDILNKGLQYILTLNLNKINLTHNRMLKSILEQKVVNNEIGSSAIMKNILEKNMKDKSLDRLLMDLTY